jgi:hypothetical protein
MSIDTSNTAPTTDASEASPRKRGMGDVYTWMLILSLLLLLAACGMLALEWSQYDFQMRPVNF